MDYSASTIQVLDIIVVCVLLILVFTTIIQALLALIEYFSQLYQAKEREQADVEKPPVDINLQSTEDQHLRQYLLERILELDEPIYVTTVWSRLLPVYHRRQQRN